MQIRVFPSGPIETNAYLLTDPDRGEAVLVDAPGEIWEQVRPVLESEGCRLVALWLTHGHWDHMQGAAEIVRETGARVLAHKADRALFERPEIMAAFLGEDLKLEPVAVDDWLEGSERFTALGTSVEVRHVPGHCPGNVLFYLPGVGNGVALVGDALFAGSVGRTDLPGGDFAMLERAIRSQIYTMPDTTVVLPGHGPPTTVGAERAGNPYVSG